MSINQLLNNPDTKNLEITATILKVDTPKAYGDGSKYKVGVQIQDHTGKRFVDILQGSGSLPNASHIGSAYKFKLSSREWQGKVFISGFWTDGKVNSPAPASSQPPQSTPQEKPSGQYVDVGKARNTAVMTTAEMVTAGKIDTKDYWMWVNQINDYVVAGKIPTEAIPAPVPSAYNPVDDNPLPPAPGDEDFPPW